MAIDIEFLKTGAKWSNLEIGQLEYSFPATLPLYFSSPVAAAIHFASFIPFSETRFTADPNPSNFDQQDIVRFLLENESFLANFSGPNQINTTLVNTTNMPIGNGETENYRVSFPDVISSFFSENTSGAGEIVLVNQEPNVILSDVSIAYLPTLFNKSLQIAGDVFINSNDSSHLNLAPGERGFWLILHELGHAIGGLDDFQVGDPNNSQKFSVMSEVPHNGIFATGLQLLDIAAIQDTYQQRNYTTRAGDTEYALGQGLGFFGAAEAEPFLYTIWDGSGIDIIDASDFTTNVTIDLRQGEFSSIGVGMIDNVAVSYFTVIENATGTDDPTRGDILIGNAWDNVLNGGGGDDIIHGSGLTFDGQEGFTAIDPNDPNDPNRTRPASDGDDLFGGAGNDLLIGGIGQDTLHGDAGDDVLIGDFMGAFGLRDGRNGQDNIFFGTGTDKAFGGDQQDTYHVFQGDGLNFIVEDPFTTQAAPIVRAHGFTSGQAHFSLLDGHVVLWFNAVDGLQTAVVSMQAAGEFNAIMRTQFKPIGDTIVIVSPDVW